MKGRYSFLKNEKRGRCSTWTDSNAFFFFFAFFSDSTLCLKSGLSLKAAGLLVVFLAQYFMTYLYKTLPNFMVFVKKKLIWSHEHLRKHVIPVHWCALDVLIIIILQSYAQCQWSTHYNIHGNDQNQRKFLWKRYIVSSFWADIFILNIDISLDVIARHKISLQTEIFLFLFFC